MCCFVRIGGKLRWRCGSLLIWTKRISSKSNVPCRTTAVC
jgi:hypothetical protein